MTNKSNFDSKKIHYSKSSKDYNNLKLDFYNQEKKFLKNQNFINKIYLKQPLRTKCKNCFQTISGYDIIVCSIKYKFCKS